MSQKTNHHPFIDTHCHLEMNAFHHDREAVIQRAKDAGLEALITIGSDFESNRKAIELAEKYSFVYASVGIHPHDAKSFNTETVKQLKLWCKNKKVVAIGETGLDYHYNHSPREIQRKVFIQHLELAKEIGLPVVIHSRDAKDDTIKMLMDTETNCGVLHCFSGDEEMAERAIRMGLYISFAGTVTYKNAQRLREIVKRIPDDCILTETDAPYLTPVPHRGKRNEPAYIIHTASTLAEIREVTIEDMARITTLNGRMLFQIGELSSEDIITYKIRDTLYLNITNRCTNKCSFCVRFQKDFVKGHNLRLSQEPADKELKTAIGNPSLYKEIVFCGYGEPLIRLETVKNVASWIKEKGGRVRINTNGHGNIIHKKNLLPELVGIVDSMSISLDAQDEETYDGLCKPLFKNAFAGVIDFIRESRKYMPEVIVTAVDAPGVDVLKCEEIAKELDVTFKLRKYNIVG